MLGILPFMKFVKLESSLLTSSLWLDPQAKELFITALLMAEPHTSDDSAPVLDMSTGEPTGSELPPGDYGLIQAMPVGLIRTHGTMDAADARAALIRLSQPDADSRSKHAEGRRLVRIEEGLVVVNFERFRTRDSTSASRTAAYRARQKSKEGADVGRQGPTSASRKPSKSRRVSNNSPLMDTIGSWFQRRPETLWTLSEAAQLEAVNPTPADIDIIGRYHSSYHQASAEQQAAAVYPRKMISSLLNNWDDEASKARLNLRHLGVDASGAAVRAAGVPTDSSRVSADQQRILMARAKAQDAADAGR